MPRTSKKPVAPPAFDKRIVLVATRGPFAGLHQITGTVSQAMAAVGCVPEFVDEVSLPGDGRMAPAGLVRSTPRFVLFKECAGPQMARLDQFNPSQR